VGEQEREGSSDADAVDEDLRSSCARFRVVQSRQQRKNIMRISDLETSASVGCDCETLDQELVHDLGMFSDDELNDDQFFTMLESLLTHGTGALVLVR
jgi:hypothetical protein